MREIDVQLIENADLDAAQTLVERLCAEDGLRLTLKGTLAKYPGSVHWHYRRGRERGTLEITLWSLRRRLWFKVSDGRGGDWMDETIVRLKSALEAYL